MLLTYQLIFYSKDFSFREKMGGVLQNCQQCYH